MSEAGSSDNGVCGNEAPLTDSTVCEEQTPTQIIHVNLNHPPPTDGPNTPSATKMHQHTPTDLPFGQQEEQPTLLEPWTALPSSSPTDPLTLHPPANTQDSAPAAIVAGSSVLPMYPSELAALHQAIRCIVLVPSTQVPLDDSTVCEEETHLQNSSTNPLPPMNHPQTSSTNVICQPTPSELPFGQQDEQPSLLSAHPSLPPNPLTLQPPPAATLCTAPSVTVARGTVLSVELAALERATRHLVRLSRTHAEVSPTEEVTRDHSTVVLVSGRGLPLLMGLPVVSGDELDRTVVKDSVTREEHC